MTIKGSLNISPHSPNDLFKVKIVDSAHAMVRSTERNNMLHEYLCFVNSIITSNTQRMRSLFELFRCVYN